MDNFFEIDDIGLAAYIKEVKQVPFLGYTKSSIKALVFKFKGTEQDKDNLSTDFINSESKKFDNGVRNFKKLLGR